jgi:hypothetical protein
MTDNPSPLEQIIYKHIHDVRNSINCLELLTGMVDDLNTEIAIIPLLKTLHTELTQLEANVNLLQHDFSAIPPNSLTIDT